MENISPDWLDENFLTLCLKEENPDSPTVKIISYQAERGVPVGNNYGSEIIRVKVTYKIEESAKTEKKVSLILKGPVQNTVMDYLSDLFGKTEANFYYKYLPKVREISQVQFAPKSYFSPLENVIVLEDLKTSGFIMADRHEQLDYNHCKQYLITVAKLHAVGVALAKKYPELPKMYPNMQASNKKDEAKATTFMKTVFIGLNCLIKSIESLKLPENNPYIDSIKKFAKLMSTEGVAETLIINGLDLQKNYLKSFVHGDCWTTNMMFKHNDSGTPVDIRLLDFQVFSYDAVVVDVTKFIWFSANNEVLENNLDDLYKLYCHTLNSALDELGCEERYPYKQLKKHIIERTPLILMIIGVFLPLTQAAEVINNSTLFSETLTEDQFSCYYQGKPFWKKYPKVLKFVASQGCFDWVEDKYNEYGLANTS